MLPGGCIFRAWYVQRVGLSGSQNSSRLAFRCSSFPPDVCDIPCGHGARVTSHFLIGNFCTYASIEWWTHRPHQDWRRMSGCEPLRRHLLQKITHSIGAIGCPGSCLFATPPPIVCACTLAMPLSRFAMVAWRCLTVISKCVRPDGPPNSPLFARFSCLICINAFCTDGCDFAFTHDFPARWARTFFLYCL